MNAELDVPEATWPGDVIDRLWRRLPKPDAPAKQHLVWHDDLAPLWDQIAAMDPVLADTARRLADFHRGEAARLGEWTRTSRRGAVREVGTMSQRRWEEAHNARTLIQAHDALVALRPKPDAPIPEWIAFHQRSSAVYQRLAQVDEGHRLEALYWATRERSKADELAGSTSRRRTTRRAPDGDAVVPVTLAQAHDALREVRPPLVAAPALWRAYHEHAAAVYAEVSEVDRGTITKRWRGPVANGSMRRC